MAKAKKDKNAKKRKHEEEEDPENEIEEILETLEREPATSDEESDEEVSKAKKVKRKPVEDESEEEQLIDRKRKAHDSNLLTQDDIARFREILRNDPTSRGLTDVVAALRAVLSSVEGDETSNEFSRYRVKGSQFFNEIMSICLTDFVPAIYKCLKISEPVLFKETASFVQLDKCHGWKKISGVVRTYLICIVKMTEAVAEKRLVLTLLRHILHLIPFFVYHTPVTQRLFKSLVKRWSAGEESLRVMAFLCLVKLMETSKKTNGEYMDHNVLVKNMYMAYVQNCHFTSPTTWPLINFMKRSLTELYALDADAAYRQAFLFIRQLAIHLRTAISIKKKGANKVIHNWQFIHCCLFWCHAMSTLRKHELMRGLIFPLGQIVTGVLRHLSGARYIPLRFHLIQALIELSAGTDTFIPVLPHLLACLDSVKFESRPAKSSMRSLNISCALRLSDSQLKDSVFRDAVVENFQDLTLYYVACWSHSIAFPELILPLMIRLKKLKKTVKNSRHTTVFKTVIDKCEANADFIKRRREAQTLDLADSKVVSAFESKLKQEGTPLSKFYAHWSKDRLEAKRLQEANQEVVENAPESGDEGEGATPAAPMGKSAKRKLEKKMKKKVISDDLWNAMDSTEPLGE